MSQPQLPDYKLPEMMNRPQKKEEKKNLQIKSLMNKSKIDDFRLSAAIYTLAEILRDSRRFRGESSGGISKKKIRRTAFRVRRREVRERTHRISDASVFTHTSEFVRSKTHSRRKTRRGGVFSCSLNSAGRDARQNSEIRVHY